MKEEYWGARLADYGDKITIEELQEEYRVAWSAD
jgi:hypothetical protein